MEEVAFKLFEKEYGLNLQEINEGEQIGRVYSLWLISSKES
jgi:hypothetical protein